MKGNLGGGGGFSSLDVGRRERRKKATASASRLFAKEGECTKGGLGGKYKSYEGMKDMQGEKVFFIFLGHYCTFSRPLCLLSGLRGTKTFDLFFAEGKSGKRMAVVTLLFSHVKWKESRSRGSSQ